MRQWRTRTTTREGKTTVQHANIRYEVDGPTAIVTLDRPRYRNAQSWQLLDELDEALDRAFG